MTKKPQRITVFQQNGGGNAKIVGINRFGGSRITLSIHDIDEILPPVIDDGRAYLPERIEADLVLDFLGHPDLTLDLAELCGKDHIPIVASGKKIKRPLVFTPPT